MKRSITTTESIKARIKLVREAQRSLDDERAHIEQRLEVLQKDRVSLLGANALGEATDAEIREVRAEIGELQTRLGELPFALEGLQTIWRTLHDQLARAAKEQDQKDAEVRYFELKKRMANGSLAVFNNNKGRLLILANACGKEAEARKFIRDRQEQFNKMSTIEKAELHHVEQKITVDTVVNA
ncbi:hypothetical protein TRIP_B200075 [uncultured Desulfatiglans sp.]|nr:hypothetical protein TRIP_B200075 [uncultured Desulfatiglans sp.]